jgi:hypothetical protein
LPVQLEIADVMRILQTCIPEICITLEQLSRITEALNEKLAEKAMKQGLP